MYVKEINSITGWIYNHSARNLWRVAGWYELEDLVNDGLMIALKCRAKLGHQVDEKAFNAYVRRAFDNHIIELTRRKLRVYEVGLVEHTGIANERIAAEAITEPSLDFQEVAATVTRLPDNLRRVLALLLTEEGRKRLYYVSPLRQRLHGEETMADRLYRLAGWPRELDFEEELTEILNVG